MNGLRPMFNVIFSVVVLFFVAGCSIEPQQDGHALGAGRPFDFAPERPQMSKEIRETAWKAYVDATGLNILAEEGPVAGDEFILFRDVQGLGKKGEKIYEVRFAILGGPETRGLVLVNEKTRQSLVVFPNKRDIASYQNKTGGF